MRGTPLDHLVGLFSLTEIAADTNTPRGSVTRHVKHYGLRTMTHLGYVNMVERRIVNPWRHYNPEGGDEAERAYIELLEQLIRLWARKKYVEKHCTSKEKKQ